MKLEPHLTLITILAEIGLRIQTLRPKTIKLLEENIGENLLDTGLGNDWI